MTLSPLQTIAGFAALLRDHGMKVGVAEQQAFVQVALALPLQRCAQLDPAWRAIACRDARDWRRWPELFETYWHPQRVKGTVKVSGQTRPSRDLRQVVQSLQDSLAQGQRPSAAGQGLDTALQDTPPDPSAPEEVRAKAHSCSRERGLVARKLPQFAAHTGSQPARARRITNHERLALGLEGGAELRVRQGPHRQRLPP